jgi:hypothetical protein
MLRLQARRRLAAGRYTLTIVERRAGRRQVVTRRVVRIS